MNPKQLRDSIQSQCGFGVALQGESDNERNETRGVWDERNKTWIRPSGTVQQGRRPMFKPFPKEEDDTCPKCGSTVCTHIWELDAQQGEPTSFSAWLERNGDSIEPLDRTESATQWFDEKEARNERSSTQQETCAYTEFVEALDQLMEANIQQGE